MNCCHKPRIQKFSGGESHGGRPAFNNFVCLTCKAHKYGEPGNEKFFTGKQWEAWINS